MNEPLLPLRLQVFAAAVLVAFLAWVVRLIRREQLGVRESLPWLLSTGAALLATVFPSTLRALAWFLGIAVPSNALFAFAFLYVLANLLTLTLATSSSAARMRRLAQECALLRAELDALRGAGAGRDGAPR